MEIILPVLILGVLGLVFGIGLAIVSKKFAVQYDPRLEKIYGLLPGSNCGACGGAGCFGFAESLLSGKLRPEACRVSPDEIKEQIAKLLGEKFEKTVKKIAVLHCHGGTRVGDRFLYQGLKDCLAVNLVLAGQKNCTWGCLGFGSCVQICPFGAIRMSPQNLPIVDKDKCKACNKCVQICPKKLFKLIAVNQNVYPTRKDAHSSGFSNGVYIACSSHDLGKDTHLVCPVGCIACRKCEQICPVGAIAVLDTFGDKPQGLTLGAQSRSAEGGKEKQRLVALSVNAEDTQKLNIQKTIPDACHRDIRSVDNLAIIDYNKCTSCGECVKVCPTKTIRIRG